jgi:hypothetical protein
MLIVDDLLAAPVKGLAFVFRSVHDAVEDHVDGERDRLRDELNQLYLMLERGEISEDDFDDREDAILDRLDELEETEQQL